MEMLLTGESMDAETAARWGLINRVVPADRLVDDRDGGARRRSPPTRRSPSRRPRSWRSAPARCRSRVGLRFEQMVNRMLQFTEDAAEGPKAFAEKRPPQFKGR